MNIVSDKRRASARKHASRAHECPCGKVCHGNGAIKGQKMAGKGEMCGGRLDAQGNCFVCESWDRAKRAFKPYSHE